MNSVNLVGNVANSVKSGNNSATAMLAIHRIYSQAKDKQTADFVPIVAFGKMAEVLSNYASKGTRIGISGRIRTGQYERDASKDSSANLSDDLINSLSPKLSGLKDSDLPF